MTAYYNEHDPFAVAWLRELIKAGHIAQGDVDERSVTDVDATDLRGYTQCHFFAGIGVWSYALRAAGWADDTPVWTGSCPCQSFSASGKREGFSDQRHLWPAWFRLIRESRPECVFGEQVASKDGLAWFDIVSSDMEGEAYTIGAVDTCAAGFGAPHIRQRLYFVAHATSGHASAEREQRSGEQRLLAEGGGSQPVADSAIPRRAGAGEHDGGQSLLPARPEQRGKDGTVADSSGRRCEQRDARFGPVQLTDADGEVSGRLADPKQQRFGARRTSEPRHEGWAALTNNPSGEASELGDTTERGLGMRGSAPGSSGRAALASEPDHMGHAIEPRLEGHAGDERDGNQPGRLGENAARSVAAASLTNGFWADAEWLWCRDGKYRPVEPGTFPLVTGATKRVGRLRGYGNSLVAPQAQAFIESYMEIA